MLFPPTLATEFFSNMLLSIRCDLFGAHTLTWDEKLSLRERAIERSDKYDALEVVNEKNFSELYNSAKTHAASLNQPMPALFVKDDRYSSSIAEANSFLYSITFNKQSLTPSSEISRDFIMAHEFSHLFEDNKVFRAANAGFFAGALSAIGVIADDLIQNFSGNEEHMINPFMFLASGLCFFAFAYLSMKEAHKSEYNADAVGTVLDSKEGYVKLLEKQEFADSFHKSNLTHPSGANMLDALKNSTYTEKAVERIEKIRNAETSETRSAEI